MQSMIIREIYEEMLLGSAVTLVLVSIIFIVNYSKRAFSLKKEYVEAKDIVSSIVLSFRRRQDDQDKKITDITSEMEGIHSTIEKLIGRNQIIEGKISNLITSIKSAFLINKNVVEHITTMREEINDLSKTQQSIQKQFMDLDEKYQKMPETVKTEVAKDEAPLEVKLTETEEQIVQFLLIEGPKTAPTVEEKIGKTREHTARLMKKLWQEGFIERDTHRIPFVYRANEKLKKSLEAKS